MQHMRGCTLTHCLLSLLSPEMPNLRAEAEPFTDSSLFAHWGQELSPKTRRVALGRFSTLRLHAYLSGRPAPEPAPA